MYRPVCRILGECKSMQAGCKDIMSVLYSNKYVNERFEKENSQGRSPNYSVRVLWVLAAY